MGIPQVVFVILMTMDITADMCWHGKAKEGKHNVWWALFIDALFAALLYWGGFFG